MGEWRGWGKRSVAVTVLTLMCTPDFDQSPLRDILIPSYES